MPTKRHRAARPSQSLEVVLPLLHLQLRLEDLELHKAAAWRAHTTPTIRYKMMQHFDL